MLDIPALSLKSFLQISVPSTGSPDLLVHSNTRLIMFSAYCLPYLMLTQQQLMDSCQVALDPTLQPSAMPGSLGESKLRSPPESHRPSGDRHLT